KYNERKTLIKYLNTSHTGFNKALAHLIAKDLVIVHKGYISAKSKKCFGKSKYNVKFQFTEEDIIDPTKYKNKIFQCLCQNVAIRYGEIKKTGNLFPQRKKTFKSLQNHEFIQMQSSQYLTKLLQRNRYSIYRKQQKIRQNNDQIDWGYCIKQYPQFGQMFAKDPVFKGKTVLTDNGFRPKVKSKICFYDSPTNAYTDIMNKKEMGIIKPNQISYISEYRGVSVESSYWVINPNPIEYKFSIPCNFIIGGKDYFFKK
ncbi:MAG: hypothetical protein EBS55_14435, partial [Flavobacteriaceae bacterium]|nr:hypothetical protein [Flavobacteriaceae bacterium]